MNVEQVYTDTKNVAKYLGISEQAVVLHRINNTGPEYLKIGRLCRYKISDVEKWLAKNNPRK